MAQRSGWAALLVAALMYLATSVACADAPLVRAIADESVLAGKVERLQTIAVASGVRFEWLYLDALPADVDRWIAQSDLLIVEAPLPSARARMQERLGDAFRRSRVPRLESSPRREKSGPPVAPPVATLRSYYMNGGDANLRNLFAYLKAWREHGDIAAVPPPIEMAESGFYHPDAPRLFATFAEYFEWGKGRWPVDAPRVGIATHSFAIAGLQTQVVDATIRRSEALGQLPFAFWFDGEDPQALQKVAQPGRPDVLVNMHHMGNAPARSAEFLKLDVPVLQTLNHRDSNAAEWRQASSGAPTRMVAPFIAVYENWGMSDPMIVSALADDELEAMPEQIDALLRKVTTLAALRHTQASQKRLALMFWNYPPGEKNLSASNLNVPRSLAAFTASLRNAGYDVPVTQEQKFIDGGQALLSVLYKHELLDGLLARDMAGTLSVERYREWLKTLPAYRQAELARQWGDPDAHWAVRTVKGERVFVIPRWQLGKLLVMPQMPRAGEPGENYHEPAMPPNHYYLAAYLYLRDTKPHALIHFGTHGTQEWLPGKDRGLSVDDYPFMAVGDVPVFYPYIQDNIGEALQAKRRGRAVIVSHQTPPFAPSGLYKELLDVHALLHEYIQLDPGSVRDRTAERLRAMIVANSMNQDLDWSEADMARDFDKFLPVFHAHLHELAKRSVPLGLHTLGSAPAAEHRLTTVLQQLGDDFTIAANGAAMHPGGGMPDMFTGDTAELKNTPPYLLLKKHLRDKAPLAGIANDELRALVARGIEIDRHLSINHEFSALLAGLSGRFIEPGPGGDPVRNPDVPNGRNLFGFEPDKLPTRSAYDAAESALDSLIADYRSKHQNQPPRKLAFSLWSVEAMRHMGITESQVLRAMGLRPVWDKGGRLTALEIVPAKEMQRPRIDVVIQVTGAYRDQFETFMRLLADATEKLARLDEPGNLIASNTTAAARSLEAKGLSKADAQRMAAVRLFGNQPGDYGVGLSDATLDSTAWETDAPLAEQYLSRLQYAYGAGKDGWGVKTEGANVYAEQLKGVDVAVLSRSSNLYGVLTGDDPYQFLGGLSLAVRHLNGKSPDLYIADLRQSEAKMTSAARFLSDEMRTRYLNPQWITTMQQEGYAGTLEIVDTMNNLWGWQAMDRNTVRADQWQAMHDVYVKDKYRLGMQEWFEKYNPTAQAQVLERMVEAIRKGYWDASEQTRREIAQRVQELAAQGVTSGAEKTRAYAAEMAAGFGLDAASATQAAASGVPQSSTPAAQADAPMKNSERISGQVMQQIEPPGPQEIAWRMWLALAALFACMVGGGLQQARGSSAASLPAFAGRRPSIGEGASYPS